MIDVDVARELLDFGVRIGAGQRAQEQLDGAVAIHNILQKHRVAYLADEVGMGKTYVALGALALFRHFQPDFRVLVIAPRENIQAKWMKEMRNFVAHNVRFPDMRVKSLGGGPARPLVAVSNLLDLVHQVTVGPNNDLFARLSSFSLPAKGRDRIDAVSAGHYRDEMKRHLPWIDGAVFDRRNKQDFKDNLARAVCCALPRFDLVIVDEGHNLKHGWRGANSSARNRVLALAMGGREQGVDLSPFRGFAPRAQRVLFLSATPVEETYRHLWNQLDIFGRGGPFDALRKDDASEERKKEVAGEFLIRRISTIRVGGEELTKNLYRREWRRGGMNAHDEPIRIEDSKQRLVVALVQKKVSELLGNERFNTSFQVGMLASFESFLETAKVKKADDDAPVFDGSDQSDDVFEREGIDVNDVNRLARSYRTAFGVEMPHPKMDALVDSLSDAWERGEKALIFVRRVASVSELKRKLGERYDAWLMDRLRRSLPKQLRPRLESIFDLYRQEKRVDGAVDPPSASDNVEVDRGGRATFFEWFFRGEGPPGVISGANIQQRFIQRGTTYSTFFEDNYVAEVLECRPDECTTKVAQALGVSLQQLRTGITDRSARYLSRAKKPARADRFQAVQAAAIEWLAEIKGPHQERARVVEHRWAESVRHHHHATQAPDMGDWLELPTFFTELRQQPSLRERLWPVPGAASYDDVFCEQELRARLLASAARLGHPLIDLYELAIRRIGSLEHRAQGVLEEEGDDQDRARISEYLGLLESQMRTPRIARGWGAFDELADIAAHFDLILDVNEPDAAALPLGSAATKFGGLLRQQQPIGGMSGVINQTLVRQFRMPGYPLVLITTELLQEGEDLHTFCSAVHHYGISWTPSSMEQRIGRIDRVRSQAERRLAAIEDRAIVGDDMLQVFFPHLEDTIEVLQVQRVLERMNVFLRLMHEGLTVSADKDRRIDVGVEMARGRRHVPQIREKLKTSFPVKKAHLDAPSRALAVEPEEGKRLQVRFDRLTKVDVRGINIDWERTVHAGELRGAARLGDRVQPFTLTLTSIESRPCVRCASPVGYVALPDEQEELVESTGRISARLALYERPKEDELSFNLAVEDAVMLADDPSSDAERVAMLIRRVVANADALEQEHLPGQDLLAMRAHDEGERGERS